MCGYKKSALPRNPMATESASTCKRLNVMLPQLIDGLSNVQWIRLSHLAQFGEPRLVSKFVWNFIGLWVNEDLLVLSSVIKVSSMTKGKETLGGYDFFVFTQ